VEQLERNLSEAFGRDKISHDVNNRTLKPSLVDNPGLLDSLPHLDRGLKDGGELAPKSPPRPLPTPRASQNAARAEPLSSRASAALAAASAALAALNAHAEPRAGTESAAPAQGPRKLIDLFPPEQADTRRPAKTSAPSEGPHFYGLAESPFDPSPDPRFHFHWDSRDRVLRDLTAAIGRRDGVILLTGAFGVGKTTLCRALVAQLGRRTLVSFVGETPEAARDLLETVLADFGVISRADAAGGSSREASRDNLASTLRNFLASLAALQAVALVVIDDAHKLTPAALGDLQVLGELAAEHKLLRLLLVGEPDLDAALRHAELKKLSDLIGLRAELRPLAAGDVADYVAHRLAAAGAADSLRLGLFQRDALARVHALSGGMPRAVNLICDRALAMGQQVSARSIDESLVDRAARDVGPPAEVGPAGPSWTRRMLLAGLMLVLMLSGAASAGWMLREPLTRVLARWHVLPGSSP
jgi:type II secretory pathway predicted ATPase ExeA